MKATVGNLRKMIKGLPDSAMIVTEDWDGSSIIKINFENKDKPFELEELLMAHDGRLYIVNEQAGKNECHHWKRIPR
jgi:hypothetical protein